MTRRAAARRGDAQHWRFRARPGSDFVASGFALGAVIDLIERRRPLAVLEVGAGIGTLTDAVAEVIERTGIRCRQMAVEDVPFCLDQLQANLAGRAEAVLVVPRAAAVPPEEGPFDLVVVDGGATEDLDPADRHRWTGEDERDEVRAWIGRLAPRALVVVENERHRQRRWIEAEAPRPFVHEHVRPLDGTPGYHRYRFDPGPIDRIGAAARDRLRGLWFPRGLRRLRRVHLRALGRAGPNRDAVAPGDASVR